MKLILQLFWVAIGLIIFSIIFYFRFIYQHLPRDIIKDYNILIIFSYIIFFITNLIRAGGFDFLVLFLPPPNPNNIFLVKIKKLISFLYKPFIEIKNIYFMWNRSRTMLINLTLLHYLFFKFSYYLPYVLFNIIPRVIFSIALSIDFSNLYFYRMYQILPVLLIPLIYNAIFPIIEETSIARLKHAYEGTFSFIWVFDKPLPLIVLLGPSSHFYLQEWAKPIPGISKQEFIDFYHLIYKATVFLSISLKIPKYTTNIILFNTLYYYYISLLWGLILLTILLS